MHNLKLKFLYSNILSNDAIDKLWNIFTSSSSKIYSKAHDTNDSDNEKEMRKEEKRK